MSQTTNKLHSKAVYVKEGDMLIPTLALFDPWWRSDDVHSELVFIVFSLMPDDVDNYALEKTINVPLTSETSKNWQSRSTCYFT